jgi:hypothetical protein
LIAVVIAAAAGCGSADPEGAGPGDTLLPVEKDSTFYAKERGKVCTAEIAGMEDATPYTEEPGIHPAGVTQQEINGSWRFVGSSGMPEDWLGGEETAQLVVCLHQVESRPKETCTGYTEGGTVETFDTTWRVEVRVATTGEVLGEQTVDAPHGPCPGLVMFEPGKSVHESYGDVDITEIVRPYVER